MTMLAQAVRTPARTSGDRSIGAILIDSGKLSLENAERIMRLQSQEGLRFGEAAIRLGLLTQMDIDQALARQYDYPYLQEGESHVSEELIAAYQPFSAQVEALRALRSQLMLRWFTDAPGRKVLAITSPERGEGRSWLAANLAVVFSQLGARTLLIDADLRNGRQHELFKLENRFGLSSILSSRGEASAIARVPSFMDLSVLTCGPMPPNPQELLGRPLFAELLAKLNDEFDIVLIDTPAGTYADTQTIAARAGGAVVVLRQNVTRMDAVAELTGNFDRHGIATVGAVLNEF